MVEIKKLERINDKKDSIKIEKTLTHKFDIISENTALDSYISKYDNAPKKLKLHEKTEHTPTKSTLAKTEDTPQKSKETTSGNNQIIETISAKEYLDNILKLEIEKKRLEVISNKLQDTEEKITSGHLDSIFEKDNNQTVDFLLDTLEKKTDKVEDEQPFMESISFLDDKPKIEKMQIKSTGVSHLYAKLDALENKMATQKKLDLEKKAENAKIKDVEKSKPIYAMLEEIEIPEIASIKDDVSISQAITRDYSTYEQSPQPKKERESNFVFDHGKISVNPIIEKYIRQNKSVKREKTPGIKINFSENEIEELVVPPIISDTKKEPIPEKQEPVSEEKPQISEKPKTAFDYILPVDSPGKSNKSIERKDNSNLYVENKEGESSNSKELMYSIKPKISDIDKLHISEKYNIDEFTFININYMMPQGLVYNIIQPELNQSQEEIYQEIKKIFLDSIDSNYMSFKGDKQNINSYIKKIFDLTIDKLSYNLTDLEKKLYFNFIRRDFSGFGFLATILEDKNIIEVNCSGENLPLVVYHLKYGGLETNLKFDNLFKLNQFVLSLTKAMGLQVNSAQPIINGYLPNGYKVEGLYSVGDISNKGSSFIIKKYLEEPLTPVSLINLGVGLADIYSYIWTAMDNGYQVILIGGEAYIFISALAQFYPDKNITSIQSFDYIKLPQKKWIKKLLLDNLVANKKTIISQVISQRPDYLILDNFTEDLFDIKWYDVSLLYIDEILLPKYLEKAKAIDKKLIIINLERTKIDNIEQMQITKISEMTNGSIQNVVSYSNKEQEFNINLISSAINITEFNNHKKILRWLIDSEITDSIDFNNIVNDYYFNKDTLLKKLNIFGS